VKKNNSQTVGSKTNEQAQDFKITNEKLQQELQTLKKQNQKQKEEYTILESKQKIFERTLKEKDDRIAELTVSTNQQFTQIATEKDKSDAYLKFIDQTKKRVQEVETEMERAQMEKLSYISQTKDLTVKLQSALVEKDIALQNMAKSTQKRKIFSPLKGVKSVLNIFRRKSKAQPVASVTQENGK